MTMTAEQIDAYVAGFDGDPQIEDAIFAVRKAVGDVEIDLQYGLNPRRPKRAELDKAAAALRAAADKLDRIVPA